MTYCLAPPDTILRGWGQKEAARLTAAAQVQGGNRQTAVKCGGCLRAATGCPRIPLGLVSNSQRKVSVFAIAPGKSTMARHRHRRARRASVSAGTGVSKHPPAPWPSRELIRGSPRLSSGRSRQAICASTPAVRHRRACPGDPWRHTISPNNGWRQGWPAQARPWREAEHCRGWGRVAKNALL